MTSHSVHEYLRQIGNQWTGQGTAMELGCWLGASSVPLLEGLVQAGYTLPYYCFDKWQANNQQIGIAKEYRVKLKNKQNLEPLFLSNVKGIYNNIQSYRGNIQQRIKEYDGGKVEICLFDAPKKNPVFSVSMAFLGRHFIPGVTILGLLDYYFYEQKTGEERIALMAPVEFIECNQNKFTKLMEWREKCSCVFFRYEGGELNV